MHALTLTIGAVFGGLAILFGAFGAHGLKKIISAEKVLSFEVGVRYQMYSALTLLLIGFNIDINTEYMKFASYSIIAGTLLFSFSIYGLSLAEYWNKNLKFLGPITPLGGLLMIIGWGFLLASFL